MLLYVNTNSPTSDMLEATLRENFSPDVKKIAENTARINSFWKAKRNSEDMDVVYSQLLRSGAGGLKRHHELTGTLAEIDAAQDPQAATLQRILAQPVTAAERAGADVGVGAGVGACAGVVQNDDNVAIIQQALAATKAEAKVTLVGNPEIRKNVATS